MVLGSRKGTLVSGSRFQPRKSTLGSGFWCQEKHINPWFQVYIGKWFQVPGGLFYIAVVSGFTRSTLVKWFQEVYIGKVCYKCNDNDFDTKF